MRIPDLRSRILFTLAILIVFRFTAHLPVPGVDRDALAADPRLREALKNLAALDAETREKEKETSP